MAKFNVLKSSLLLTIITLSSFSYSSIGDPNPSEDDITKTSLNNSQANLDLEYVKDIVSGKKKLSAFDEFAFFSDNNINKIQEVASPELLLELGHFLKMNKEFKLAITVFSDKKLMNNVDALYQLAWLYTETIENEEDLQKAFDYASKAYELGELKAAAIMGDYYAFYKKPEALHIYEIGLKVNDPWAQNSLGILYDAGELVPRDLDKAHELYLLSAQQNFKDAIFNLANLYSDRDFKGFDFKESFKYSKKAYEIGDTDIAELVIDILQEEPELLISAETAELARETLELVCGYDRLKFYQKKYCEENIR